MGSPLHSLFPPWPDKCSPVSWQWNLSCPLTKSSQSELCDLNCSFFKRFFHVLLWFLVIFDFLKCVCNVNRCSLGQRLIFYCKLIGLSMSVKLPELHQCCIFKSNCEYVYWQILSSNYSVQKFRGSYLLKRDLFLGITQKPPLVGRNFSRWGLKIDASPPFYNFQKFSTNL